MKNNQQHYLDYIKQFAERNKCHIWLSGSFLHGNACAFSDIDIRVFCNTEKLKELIYGYGKPVYLSFTHKPLGILIIIYEDGVAVDLEIISKTDVTDGEYFHTDDLPFNKYHRNEDLCKAFSLKDDAYYHTARLFHRSLIKFLSSKQETGVSIAKEVAAFFHNNILIDKENYKSSIAALLNAFHTQYPLPSKYLAVLCELIEVLNEKSDP